MNRCEGQAHRQDLRDVSWAGERGLCPQVALRRGGARHCPRRHREVLKLREALQLRLDATGRPLRLCSARRTRQRRVT